MPHLQPRVASNYSLLGPVEEWVYHVRRTGHLFFPAGVRDRDLHLMRHVVHDHLDGNGVFRN